MIKTTTITISPYEFEVKDGKLHHKILKKEVTNHFNKKLTEIDLLILGLKDAGNTYREIADYLNAKGIKTKHGKTHHPGSILNRLWYLKKEAGE